MRCVNRNGAPAQLSCACVRCVVQSCARACCAGVLRGAPPPLPATRLEGALAPREREGIWGACALCRVCAQCAVPFYHDQRESSSERLFLYLTFFCIGAMCKNREKKGFKRTRSAFSGRGMLQEVAPRAFSPHTCTRDGRRAGDEEHVVWRRDGNSGH